MKHSSHAQQRFPARLVRRAGHITAIASLLLAGAPTASTGAETESDSSTATSPLSLRISGEFEHLDTHGSLINPSNVLGRSENRFEPFILGNFHTRAPGGNVEGEVRFGYRNLFSNADDIADENTFQTRINQLYYQSSSSPLAVLIGRKKVRWGVSYAYSPTDLVSQTRKPEDPEDRLNLVKGADLLQLSWIQNNGQFDLVYMPETNWNTSESFITRNRLAARLYRLIDPFDVSVVGRIEEGGNWSAGGNTTVTVGDALELHAEYLYSSLNDRQYPDLSIDPSSLATPFFSGSNDGTHQFVLGGQYTFPRKWNLTMEYLFRSEGFTSDEFTAYRDRLNYLDGEMSINPAAIPYYYEAVSNFTVPLNRNYLFTRLYQPEILKSLSVELFSYVSLDDGSGMCVFMPKYESGDNYDIYLRLKKFWGGKSTDFGMVPDDLSVVAGFSWYLL